MRDYGVISPKFWIGGTGKTLRGNQEAQIVALYLMTSPHANMIGVFYCPLDTIAKETGLTSEGAWKGLQSLIEADFCQFDESTEEVFTSRMAAYQVGEQLEAKDNRCKGVARELERVMSDRLKAAFRAIYSEAFHLPKPALAQPPAIPKTEAPSEPLQSQKQEQDQKQDQKTNSPTVSVEPPDGDPQKPTRIPCPYGALLQAFHDECPTMPRVMKLSPARKTVIAARWREVDEDSHFESSDDGVAIFRAIFRRAHASDFLSGRSGKFTTGFDWLIQPKNFLKLCEGNYDNRSTR